METNTRIESWEREIDRRAGLRVPSARLTYRPVEERTKDFNEACLGYTPETARLEASLHPMSGTSGLCVSLPAA